MLDAVFDLADRDVKRDLLSKIGALRTKVRVRITDARRGRTNQQNKWYHACIVKAFSEYCTECYGEPITTEQAHEWLKTKFLNYSVVNKVTGEYETFVKSTTQLTTKEMAEYCELCRNYLAESCEITVPDPDPNWKHEN